jgi:hypothetical protein
VQHINALKLTPDSGVHDVNERDRSAFSLPDMFTMSSTATTSAETAPATTLFGPLLSARTRTLGSRVAGRRATAPAAIFVALQRPWRIAAPAPRRLTADGHSSPFPCAVDVRFGSRPIPSFRSYALAAFVSRPTNHVVMYMSTAAITSAGGRFTSPGERNTGYVQLAVMRCGRP